MAEGEQEQVVTPWEAHAAEGQAAIDYGKLISKFFFAALHYNIPLISFLSHTQRDLVARPLMLNYSRR